MCTLERLLFKAQNNKELFDQRIEDIMADLEECTIDTDAANLLFSTFQATSTCRLFVKHARDVARNYGRTTIQIADIKEVIVPQS